MEVRYTVKQEMSPKPEDIRALLPGVEVGLTYDGNGLRSISVPKKLTLEQQTKLKSFLGKILIEEKSL